MSVPSQVIAEDPWILLDQAIEHVILALHGEGARLRMGHPWIINNTKVGLPEHPFIIVNTKLYRNAFKELRRVLAEGEIIGFEEIADPDCLEPQHRQIAPVEWSTLVFHPTIDPLDIPKRRIRLRRADVESRWPAKKTPNIQESRRSRSPYEKDRAHAIFRENGGWLHLNQGQATAELHAIYSRAISNSPLPSPQTIESWVREWTLPGERPKGRV